MFDFFRESLNLEIGDVRIEDVAEKIGAIISEEARQVGKFIDNLTKDVTIVIGRDKDDDE
jgi:hypothetical protein